MSKKNEDSVERFFRKAASSYDTSYKESDWQKMEKMLDERDAAAAAIRTKRIQRTIVSAVVGTAVIFTLYLLTFDRNKSQVAQVETPKQMQVATDKRSPLRDEGDKEKSVASLHSSSDRSLEAQKENLQKEISGSPTVSSAVKDDLENENKGQRGNQVVIMPGKSQVIQMKENHLREEIAATENAQSTGAISENDPAVQQRSPGLTQQLFPNDNTASLTLGEKQEESHVKLPSAQQ
jgi:hypothetical protein